MYLSFASSRRVGAALFACGVLAAAPGFSQNSPSNVPERRVATSRQERVDGKINPNTAAGRVGQRQFRTSVTAISPATRIDNRLSSRLQNRVNSRLDRNHTSEARAAAALERSRNDARSK